MIGDTTAKRPRGLAAMSPERRREIASKGGRTSQARGTAHQWTAEEASEAGKKGSNARYANRKSESEQADIPSENTDAPSENADTPTS